MRPAALDKTLPYTVIRGPNTYRFTQVVNGKLYGFDKDGLLCYDAEKDPNAMPLPKQQEVVSNVPPQHRNKKLDRKRPYGTARGPGVSYQYFQDHMGFDQEGNAVYCEPGHWGLPPQEALDNIPEPPSREPVVDEISFGSHKPVKDEKPEATGLLIDEPEGDEIYPMKYLQSLSVNQLKALWFQHGMGDWRGKRGKPAKVKAIEELAKLTSTDLADIEEDGDNVLTASTGTD